MPLIITLQSLDMSLQYPRVPFLIVLLIFFLPAPPMPTTYPLELYFFRQMRDILLRDIVSYHLCPFLIMEKLIFKKSRA